MSYTPISMPNSEAQFLETRKFQVSEICRIYRVPPHMVGDLEHATFSNIEHQSISFAVHTIRPWVVRLEQAMNRALFSDKENHKFRYIWLYKVRAKPVTENYATKEGKSITRQTGEVEWTAIRRTHDNQYQAVADEDENGFTAAKGATFLQSVYEPVFATGG